MQAVVWRLFLAVMKLDKHERDCIQTVPFLLCKFIVNLPDTYRFYPEHGGSHVYVQMLPCQTKVLGYFSSIQLLRYRLKKRV